MRRHRLAQLVHDYEKDLLTQALEQFSGRATDIARYFKMGRNTLYNRLEILGINLTEWRERWRRNPRIVKGKLIVPYGSDMRRYLAKKQKIKDRSTLTPMKKKPVKKAKPKKKAKKLVFKKPVKKENDPMYPDIEFKAPVVEQDDDESRYIGNDNYLEEDF